MIFSIINFRFIWERTSVILGSSQVIIKWEIPDNVLPGEYRIRHNGYYRYILGGIYPYQGVSNHFKVNILKIETSIIIYIRGKFITSTYFIILQVKTPNLNF